jgi:hypothetical protein
MKIRDGYITNSSSTNFLLISKKEITREHLMKKLGFMSESPIYEVGDSLVSNILNGIDYGLVDDDLQGKNITYEQVKDIFGEESANKFNKLTAKGYHVYYGKTDTNDDYLTAFFTMDYFIIDDKDFYLDGKDCVW